MSQLAAISLALAFLRLILANFWNLNTMQMAQLQRSRKLMNVSILYLMPGPKQLIFRTYTAHILPTTHNQMPYAWKNKVSHSGSTGREKKVRHKQDYTQLGAKFWNTTHQGQF